MKRKGRDHDTARMESILPRTGDYSTWTEHELRLVEGNDALSSELKKIAARYIGCVVTRDDKETKP